MEGATSNRRCSPFRTNVISIGPRSSPGDPNRRARLRARGQYRGWDKIAGVGCRSVRCCLADSLYCIEIGTPVKGLAPERPGSAPCPPAQDYRACGWGLDTGGAIIGVEM